MRRSTDDEVPLKVGPKVSALQMPLPRHVRCRCQLGTSWRYLLLDRHFNNVLCEDPSSVIIKHLLRAALRKSTSQNSFATAAVLQQSGLGPGAWRWRGRGQGTGQAGAVDNFVVFGRSMGLSQAVVEMQVSFALLL